MTAEVSTISLAPQAAHLGSCDLCARGAAELVAVVSVTQPTGAGASFATCSQCERAIRRLAATAGDLLRFVAGSPAAVAAATVAADVEADAYDVQVVASELIHEFADPLQGADGRLYLPRVFGAPRADGTWIGWLEFAAIGESVVLRTNRETTQPNRAAVAYWASGLQASYLEGAFRRAARPHVIRL